MHKILIALLALSAVAYPKSLEQQIAEAYDLQEGRGMSLIKKKDQIRKNIMNGLLADMTTSAIDATIKNAARELDKRGYHAEAQDARDGWAKYNRMVFEIMEGVRPVGDHPGVIWMLDLHAKIENLIGIDICEALRIHDLWKIGMTVGVVFRCQDSVPDFEYFQHFSMLVGVVAYWIGDIACMAVTSIPFICGFAGMGVEKLVVLFVVPVVQQSAFNFSCKKPQWSN